MFYKTKKISDSKEFDNSINIIGNGTTLKGDIDTSGNVRLEGFVIGNIRSKAKVVLGNKSRVDGDMNSQFGEISGVVNGSIKISEVLILRASAIINGDIYTKKLVLEEGAQFNGKCKMGDPSKDSLNDIKTHKVDIKSDKWKKGLLL